MFLCFKSGQHYCQVLIRSRVVFVSFLSFSLFAKIDVFNWYIYTEEQDFGDHSALFVDFLLFSLAVICLFELSGMCVASFWDRVLILDNIFYL